MWTKVKNLVWQWRGVWITTPTVTGLIILLRLFGLLQSWEWGVFDLYMRWRPQEPKDDRVVIVSIDDRDIHHLQRSAISDATLAKLLNKLKAQQPRAIGLDIYRDLPVDHGYEDLAKVFTSTPNLVGIQKVVGKSDRDIVAPPPILKERDQVGANDLVIDADNKVRRSFFYLTDNNGKTVFSFSLHLALHYLEKEGIFPNKDWQIGKAQFRPFEAYDGGYVRADAKGYQILINYRGGSRYFESISMTDVLLDKVPKNWGRDRVILIGNVAESSKDFFFTPYSSTLLSLPEPMTGVEIHANLTSQIISAALDNRSLFKSRTEPEEWLWIFFWSFVGATLTWQLRYHSIFALERFVCSIITLGILLGSGYIAFIWGWWLPIVPALIALISSAIGITAFVARSVADIRKIFGRYLNEAVVANLLESPEGLKLGGERRKITILTSDLRGFTATSERLQPEEVVKILNFYLECMADVITQYQGTIDEFMGDGILVLFGAPTQRKDDAERAVACAVAMQLAMEKVNTKMQEWGLLPLAMGIGINTGVVVVGNIGSEKRTKYGIVGNQVNLTYRIEGYTIGGQILISESTLKEVGSIAMVIGQKQVKPQGVKEPITIYQIGGISDPYNLVLPSKKEELKTLPQPISIQYAVLDGKDICDTLFKGSFIKLSCQEAEVCVENISPEELPAELTNIKLNLLSFPLHELADEDVYAKVLTKPTSQGNFYISFTSKPPTVEAKLKSLISEVSHN
ncbi:adenylate cyclase [Richelia sinica FACHB-800]|uniref:Adenylate cyclase n=1 Tax=Richelia sinica FACHB-800 TaxID=1357546 RepID=A0A975Y3S4_9NOST|nr:adenylate/guanylate cyclase domain-containing protein [Richelia sinica]MBD2664325.1 adenylate/guanylate cyclase domain-containing protein [Richelia sinica FACHB-800]QXE22439.1 adenylate cyclase [Richelia sinica FACHB-800]